MKIPQLGMKLHVKAYVRIEVYKKLLWRATTKCGEQLKCGEQKYIEDIILVRWQHHI